MDASRSLLDLLRPNQCPKERNNQGSVGSSKGISDVQSNFLSILIGKPGDTLDKTGSLSLKPSFQSEYISNFIESKNEGLLKDVVKKERSVSASERPTSVSSAIIASNADRSVSAVVSPAAASPGASSSAVSMTPSQNGLLSILLTDAPPSNAMGPLVSSTGDVSSNTWSVGAPVSGGSLATSTGTSVPSSLATTTPAAPSTSIGALSINEKPPKTLFTATNIFDQLSITNPRMSDLKPKKILKAPPRMNESGVPKLEGDSVPVKNLSDHPSTQKLNLKKDYELGKFHGFRRIVFPDAPFMRLIIPLAKNLGFCDKIELSEIARLTATFDSLNNHTIDADKNYLAYAIPKDGNLRLMNQDDGSHILLTGQLGSKIHDISFSKYAINPQNITYLMSTNSNGGVVIWNILKTSFNNPSKSVKMVFRFNGEHSMSNTEIRAKFCPIPNIIAIKLLNRIYFFKFSHDRFEELQRYEISLSNSNIGFIVAEKYIEDFSFSPDGRVLVTIHEDGTAELWTVYEHIEHSIKFVISTPSLSYAVSNEPLCWVSFIGSKQPNALSKHLIFGLRNNKKLYLLDLDTGLISQELVLTGNSENSNSEVSSVALYDNDSQNLIVNDYFGFLYRFHYNNKDLDTSMAQDSYIKSLVSKNTTINTSSRNWSLFDSFCVFSFVSKRTLHNFNVVSINDSALDLFAAHDKGYTILHLPDLEQEIAREELSESNINTYTPQSMVITDDSNDDAKPINHSKEISTEQKISSDIRFQNTQDQKQEIVRINKRKKLKNDDTSSINKKEINDIGESSELNFSLGALNINDNSCNISDQVNLKKFIKVFLSNEFNKQSKRIEEIVTQRDDVRANQEKLLLQVFENLNNNTKELIEKNVSLSVKNNILPIVNKFYSNNTDRQSTQLMPYMKKLTHELATEIHNTYMKSMDKAGLARDISENLEKALVKGISFEMESLIKGIIIQLESSFFQKIAQIETKYDEKIDFLLKHISEERKKDLFNIEALLKSVSSLEMRVSDLLFKMDLDKPAMGDFHKSKEEVVSSVKDLLAKSYYNDVLAIWAQSPYKNELFDMYVTIDPKVMLGNASYIILFSVANALSEIMEDIDDPLMEKKLQWLELCFKLLMGMESHCFSGITSQILVLIENRMDNLYERLRQIVPRVSYLRTVLSILHFANEKKRKYFKIFENHLVDTSCPYSLENIQKRNKVESETKKTALFAQITQKVETSFFQRNIDREVGKQRIGYIGQPIARSYDTLWINRLFMHHIKEPNIDRGSLITCLNFSPNMNHILFGTSYGLLGAIRMKPTEDVYEPFQWNISRSTSELTSLNVDSRGRFVCTFMGDQKNPGHFQIGTIKNNVEENLFDYDINVTILPRGKNALWTSAIASSGQMAVIGGSKMAMVIKGLDNDAQCTTHFYNLKSDVFAVDFLDLNVFLIGCRSGWVDFFDVRCEGGSRLHSIELGIRHKSSVTNFGLIGDYYLIVAGLENSLDMYDIRMLHSKNSFSQSLLSFNGHVNEYSFGLGFDISLDKRVVAAAGHDQIRFWSTMDGKLLRKKPIKFNKAPRAFKFCQASTKWFEELCVANEAHLEWWCSS
ncbi:hypothetical protein PMAC_002420 [Pneumocystis sp. 'macacae']|nr:hypothetical protein PMAC_002420 [Pneumocystis sp. 'macacae']